MKKQIGKKRSGIRLRKRFIATISLVVVCLIFFLTWRLNPTKEDAILALAPLDFEPISLSSRVDIPLTAAYRATLTDTGYLKLVNRDLYIRRQTDSALIVSAWPTVQVSTTAVTIHQTALNAIAALLNEERYIGDFDLFVTSGYRSADRQREIYYDPATDRAYVLPPGHSEHQLGLAADILIMGVPMNQMSGRPEAIWLAENAWQYGLILRYPRWAVDITGVAYEPWHFRYVGRVHAWYMRAHNMVLEQYFEYLEEHGGFTVNIDGVTYHILYQQPTYDGMLQVPYNLEFTLSSSNRGGYVITAWE